MAYDVDDNVEEIFDGIFVWDKDHPGKISMDFVNSVYDFWNDKGYVTDGQLQGLVNICQGFKIGD